MNRSKIIKGSPLPLGTNVVESTVNFSIFCPTEKLTLCLFNSDQVLIEEIALNPLHNKTGDIWHIAIEQAFFPIYYAYKKEESEMLLDPYAKATTSNSTWGDKHQFLGMIDKDDDFDWDNETPLKLPLNELIIYEMHVRGFTQDPSSDVEHPGTFQGLIDKIPHLVALGVNAVELLPIQEFNENENLLKNPLSQAPLYNFWGYSTLNYFALMNRYADKKIASSPIHQFKTLVKELHKNGIEVILDVVFNHTAEGNEQGPVYSFKGLANSVYYLMNGRESYSNYTGCGNTLNCNQPVVIQLILDCLRYWVVEMHVDGFRFDLTTIFLRGESGEPLDSSPLIEAISLDPVLANTKLIAEPWDAAGLYRLGQISKSPQRWSEWNDQYRDTVRKFIKGTPGVKANFATSLCGSQTIFWKSSPCGSVNFVTCHDGFTLADLVSYNHKHNTANGENNRDGNSFNDSWNCGIEGPATDPKILNLRRRQMRNFHTALMLSQGIPMLHMGDEYGHTKNGNNNTWCQDNKLNWFLWDQLDQEEGFFRFYCLMIAFRKRHPFLKHTRFLTDQDIEWHGSKPHTPLWDIQDCLLAFTLKSEDSKTSIYAAFNAHDYKREVHLPENPEGSHWCWVINTAKASPDDFYEEPEKHPVKAEKLQLMPHSVCVLIAKM